MEVGPPQCSLELVRQWIRDNMEWNIGDDVHIHYNGGRICKYYPDLKSTGFLRDDGCLLVPRPAWDPGHYWNPVTLECDDDLDTNSFTSLIYDFMGAGAITQLMSLELRVMVPTFESLSSSYTIIRSFSDQPVILPYDLLGDEKSPQDSDPTEDDDEEDNLSLYHRSERQWKAGPISLYLCKSTLILKWGKDKHVPYSDVICNAAVNYRIYQNGIILDIVPDTFGYNKGGQRFATVMILNK